MTDTTITITADEDRRLIVLSTGGDVEVLPPWAAITRLSELLPSYPPEVLSEIVHDVLHADESGIAGVDFIS
jgi:hypothetical protein